MKFIIVIAFFTIFQSSQGASFIKKAEDNICADALHDHYLVPDPTDCHYFYSCVADGSDGFIAHRFKCAATLAFDDNQKQCDYEELVASCRAATTTTTVPTTTTTEPTTTTEQTTTEPEEPETTTEPEEPETTTEPEEPETTTEPEEPETTTEPEEPETTTEPEEPETTTVPEPESTTTTDVLPQTETICENFEGDLSCEGSKTIHVSSAFYGRHDYETCPRPSHIQTINCHSDRLDYVRGECEGKNSCTVASNNGFGDPCRNTYKYLQTTYYCI